MGAVTAQQPESYIDAEDQMTLRGVTMRYKDSGSWTPKVEYSTNGGLDWTDIADGATVGSNTGRINAITYRALVPDTWFQFRVSNTTGGRMRLHSLLVEFTRSGNVRHQ